MRDKINQHTEGDTYVIPDVNVTAVENADVKRPNQDFDWDDLLLMENSNQSEAKYIPPEHENPKQLEKTLARAKKAKVGARILAVFGESA